MMLDHGGDAWLISSSLDLAMVCSQWYISRGSDRIYVLFQDFCYCPYGAGTKWPLILVESTLYVPMYYTFKRQLLAAFYFINGYLTALQHFLIINNLLDFIR